MQPDQYKGPGLPDENTPLTDPNAVEFKIAQGQVDRDNIGGGLADDGARIWLGLPVPPGMAPRRRTIDTQEVPSA